MDETGRSIVLFSGLGADARLFREQKARFPSLTVLPWIEPRRAESLAQYASRLMPDVARYHPAFVGGASFGGMVALEVARLLQPQGVFLLGSCRSASSIRAVFRFGAAVANGLPEWMLRRGEFLARPVARVMGAESPEFAELLADMYRSVPVAFIRWGLGALRTWGGVEDPGVPVRHLHGQRDRIISPSRVSPDRFVPGAGHLLTLTHPLEVNEFLSEWVDQAP